MAANNNSVKEIVDSYTVSSDSSAQTSADRNLASADPNVYILSNAVNMAVESLGKSLGSQIGTSLQCVNTTMMKFMSAWEEKQTSAQVRPFYEGTCVEDTTASHSCYQDGAGEMSHIKSQEMGAPRSAFVSDGASNTNNKNKNNTNDNFDFSVRGYITPPKNPGFSPGGRSAFSLKKWETQQNLNEGDDSPSRHSEVSLGAPPADEFDEAVQKFTQPKSVQHGSSPHALDSGVPTMDSLYTRYIEEYQPDTAFGPGVSEDLARTVNLFCGKKLPPEKLKERRLREMRPENVDLSMRTTNSTIFKLNCGDISHARSTDIKLQHVEANVVKATYPILRAVDELQKLQTPSLAPAISKLLDGIILLTDTVQDCEQSRRDLYKTVLPESWKGLLVKPEDQHEELFGDVEARLKTCQTDTKLQEQVHEERAKESKKKSLSETTYPVAKSNPYKRRHFDYSGYSASNRGGAQNTTKYPKNENRFPRQNQGPAGKRYNRRQDRRGRGKGNM